MKKGQSISLFKRTLTFTLLVAMCLSFFSGFAMLKNVRAEALSDNVILRQVYGGGGKSDTPFTNSFIELYNPTNNEISLSGKSLQYMSFRGGTPGQHAGNTDGAWINYAFEAGAKIAANSSYLVRCAAESTSVQKITLDDNNTDAFWDRVIDNDKKHAIALVNTANLLTETATSENIVSLLSGEGVIDSIYTGSNIAPSKQRAARKTDDSASSLSGSNYTNWEELTYGNNDTAFDAIIAAHKEPHFSGGSVLIIAEDGTVILRQVYGGGAKGDTPFNASFIELYNPTNEDISLNGLSLQYLSHRGDSGKNAGDTNGQWVNYNFEASAEVKANSGYLVRCAAETGTPKIALNEGNTDAYWNRVIDNNQEHMVILIPTANLITKTISAEYVGTANKLDEIKKAALFNEVAEILSSANIIDSVYIGYTINPDGIGVSKQRPVRKTDNGVSRLSGTTYENWEQLKYNDDEFFANAMADYKDPQYSGGYTYVGERREPSGGGSTFVPPTESANNIPTTEFTDSLNVKKLAGAKVNPLDADGGAAEIVHYNKHNNKFYSVSGSSYNQLYIGDISALTSNSNNVALSGTRINIAPLVASKVSGFTFGDFTSLDISPDGNYVALAIQEADFTKQGLVLILDKDGAYVHHVKVGVQPDMLTFTLDGKKILTADEGEARNGYAGGAANPKGSVSIVDISGGIQSASAVIADFTAFDSQVAALLADNVLILDGVAPSLDFEPEYIAINGASTFAYVSLQEANAVATLNLTTKQFTSVKSLGFVDYSTTLIDAIESPEDYINLQNVNGLYGVRMPDGIAVYEVGGEIYILTANEGDAREFGEFTNVRKQFGTDALRTEHYANLNPDNVYLFGGRGFSIFKASDMSLVYDSGSDFETVTAQRLPERFNVSNDGINKDARSKKKGPEPENVTVGLVGDKMYAYVALERIGGIMTYDITDVSDVKFANYTNSRDFSSAIGTDCGPEGMAYVAASDSPTHTPLLIVAFETSGDVAVYQLGADFAKIPVAVATPTYNGAALKYGDSLPTITTTTSSEYGTIALDAGQTLQVGTHSYNWTFTPSDTEIYEYTNLTGTISLTVAKAAYSGSTPTIEVESKTTSSIKVKAVSGAEYSKDGTTWQDSNEFSGLNADTEYTIYCRIKATANIEASASVQQKVTTNKESKGCGSIGFGESAGLIALLMIFAVGIIIVGKRKERKVSQSAAQ